MPSALIASRVERAVKADPLSVPSVSVPGAIAWSSTACLITAVASAARRRSSSDQPTISRVQQSMIAFRYTQPWSATQTLVMSRCQSWPGRSTLKTPGRRRRLDRSPLDQLLLAHHPQHALAVDRDVELAADKAANHPVAVGRVALRRLDDRDVDRIGDW